MMVEIPDGFIVRALADAIAKPGAEERAVKLAKLFRDRHPDLTEKAIAFTDAIAGTLAGS